MMQTEHSGADRDGGFTLVEVIVTVLLTGLLAGVLSAAVIVVLRSEDGIARTVGESHDLQQAVNYLPYDVGVAPTDPAAYSTTGAAICGGATNVLSISYPDNSSVSYVLVSGSATRLDRATCDSSGTVTETLNVADLLDPRRRRRPRRRCRPAVARWSTSVWRWPASTSVRPTSWLPLAGSTSSRTPSQSAGRATPKTHLEETQGFLTFVEGKAKLSGNSQTYKAIGIGGELTFNGAQVASHGGNDTYRPASVGIYANTVNWAASSGTLEVQGTPNGHVVLTGEVAGVDITTEKDGNITYIREFGTTGTPQIKANHGHIQKPNPGHTIQFPAAFTELRACSEAIAQLPASCDGCATHVVPLHVNSNSGNLIPYDGTGDLKLDLTPDTTNVLNIGESRLAAIGAVTPTYLDIAPMDNNKKLLVDSLVVNVIDDDPSNDIDVDGDGEVDSVVRLANPMLFQNYTPAVMWNFAGIDKVEIPIGIWGTVYAPFSIVDVGNNVQGNLVAAEVNITGGVINEARSFDGTIKWS
ncbi:MAG: collagen-binding domain-containing protein [Ilumatobacteraceae bacterium]